MNKRKHWWIVLLIVLSLTLSGCSEAGTSLISRFPFGAKLDNPAITECNVKTEGIEVKWDKIEDADKYQLYRKQNDEEWTMITETDSELYYDTDVMNEQSYSYYVRSVSEKIESAETDMDENSYSVVFYKSPEDLSVSSGFHCVHLEWTSMNSIDRYRIYKKEVQETQPEEATESVVPESTSTEITEVTEENVPESTSTEIADSAEVNGWHELTLVNGNRYDDTGVFSGHTYVYTICCVNEINERISAYDEAGQTVTYVEAPLITALKNSEKGVDIEWKPIEGVEKYRVFRQIVSADDSTDSSWEAVADVDACKYTDASVENNTGYLYSVSCLDTEGKNEISSYDPGGTSTVYYRVPDGMQIANTINGVKLSWTPVAGVNKYISTVTQMMENFRLFLPPEQQIMLIMML